MTSKQDRINALRDHIHSQISYGSGYGDAIKVIVDGLTDMLLVLAEADYDEIAKQMTKTALSTPFPTTVDCRATELSDE